MIKQVSGTEPSLLSLSKISFSELRKIYRPTSEAQRNQASSTDDWTCLGYYLDHQLVGLIKAKLSGNTLDLRALAVISEYRKRGVARNLILEAGLMFSNADLLSVWCVEQTGNVKIFEALGFEVAERVESEIFELVDSSNVNATEVRLERYSKRRLRQ
ncbi:GNAT family N-acetyltransferase [Enterovibrio calviensis]|uniref:GNAT family N-acetyltransferase n=1 Tax=Enterovibrio calviensis TaxID=91359 RepID=UPI000487A36D|nr:GNAT family N-acetyltransferase [Enterovibrio calviensis]